MTRPAGTITAAALIDLADAIEHDDRYGPLARLVAGAILRGRAEADA